MRDGHRVGEEADGGLRIVDRARRLLEEAGDDQAYQQPYDRERAHERPARRLVAELDQRLLAQAARGLEVAVLHEAIGQMDLGPDTLDRREERFGQSVAILLG